MVPVIIETWKSSKLNNVLVNRSFITLLWWCRSTGTFLLKKKKKDGKTNAPFPVSKTVLHVSFLSTLTDAKSKLEITINHSGFFYHSLGCIPIELTSFSYFPLIYKSNYAWVYDKTFEFLQVYKDIEFMNANHSFNKSYCFDSHKTSSMIGMTSSIL